MQTSASAETREGRRIDLHLTGETILVPSTVLAETCFWLNKHGGARVEAAFLDAIADGTFQLVDITTDDIERMAELVRQFASFPLGGTDASVVAVAERLLNRAILAGLALGLGLIGVLMLAIDAGPVLAGTGVLLLAVLGWTVLFGASVLLLRVLLEVLRP
jgi:predicted nucleic acid-binding protein